MDAPFKHEKAAVMKYLFDAKENYLEGERTREDYLDRVFSFTPLKKEPVVTKTANNLTTDLYKNSTPMYMLEDKLLKNDYSSNGCQYK
jgi:hypothetical protein